MSVGIFASSRLLGESIGGGGGGGETLISNFKDGIYTLDGTTGLTVDDIWGDQAGWATGWVSATHVTPSVGYGSHTDNGMALKTAAYDIVTPANVGFVCVVVAKLPAGAIGYQQFTWLDLDFDPESYVSFGDPSQLTIIDPNDNDEQYPDPGWALGDTVTFACKFTPQTTSFYTPGTGVVTATSGAPKTGFECIGWAPYDPNGTTNFVIIEKIIFYPVATSIVDAYDANI